VSFTISKASAENVLKKSPLAGWLGRKADNNDDEILPEIDVAAGLTRALRNTHRQGARQSQHDTHEPIREALTAIEAALYAIDNIRDILEQACDVAISAKGVEEPGGRALLAESYDELRLSITKAIDKTDERTKLLIGKQQRHLDVSLGGKTHYSVSAMCLDASDKGLKLSPPRDAFATYEEIDTALEELDGALARADRAAGSYCRDAQFLIARMSGG